LQLNPGDEVKFSAGAPDVSRRTVDPEIVSSWTTGRLKFRATALAEVLAEVNRYSKTQITLKDPTLAQTPVNGVFEIGNSASVVSALQIMLPIAIDRQDRDGIALTRR
jgi:transmembrane sensor